MSNKNSVHQPALPTFPIQDNLGQVIVNFGLSRLEYAAIHISGVMAANGDLHPETIAQQSVEIAKQIFKECAQEFDQDNDEKQTAKILKL
jgi:hypothetical protein